MEKLQYNVVTLGPLFEHIWSSNCCQMFNMFELQKYEYIVFWKILLLKYWVLHKVVFQH